MNQDASWRKIQLRLCEIALKEGVRLGCPDFVNTGPDWKEQANTCCGVNVPNPSRFNTHFWKRRMQKGVSRKKIIKSTWEGIGDETLSDKILRGSECDFFTMRDAGVLK